MKPDKISYKTTPKAQTSEQVRIRLAGSGLSLFGPLSSNSQSGSSWSPWRVSSRQVFGTGPKLVAAATKHSSTSAIGSSLTSPQVMADTDSDSDSDSELDASLHDDYPKAEAVDLRAKHLISGPLNDLSAGQLEVLQQVLMDRLNKCIEARVSVAEKVHRDALLR